MKSPQRKPPKPRRMPAVKVAPLSQRDLVFARHFATSGDPLRAAMSAGIGRLPDGGWDVDQAKDEGMKLLSSPVLARYIHALNAQDASWYERKADADKVHAYLDGMLATTPMDFFFLDETGQHVAKPHHMLDDIQRAAVKKYTQRRITKDGTTYDEVDVELFDKTKVLAVKAKILGMLDGVPIANPDDAARSIRAALVQIEETDGAGPNS